MVDRYCDVCGCIMDENEEGQEECPDCGYIPTYRPTKEEMEELKGDLKYHALKDEGKIR